ncbi:MAG: hypothetical protein FD165_2258 [Gammaproteobacteria bacterium]|nr:MAG: hypothetical protein FD165_2258 [Gammaproteobacteria bacterium]TND03219.1 MAG: hypothetical protein FD120_1892 [Gammaproteobacteria bacterium]
MMHRIVGLIGFALIVAAAIVSREELGLLFTGERAIGVIVAKSLDNNPDRKGLWPGVPLAPPAQGFIMVRFVGPDGEQMIAEGIGYFESLFDVGQNTPVVYHAGYAEGARVSRYWLLIWPALALAGAGCVLLAMALVLLVFAVFKRRSKDRRARNRNPEIKSDLTKTFDTKKQYERRDP